MYHMYYCYMYKHWHCICWIIWLCRSCSTTWSPCWCCLATSTYKSTLCLQVNQKREPKRLNEILAVVKDTLEEVLRSNLSAQAFWHLWLLSYENPGGLNSVVIGESDCNLGELFTPICIASPLCCSRQFSAVGAVELGLPHWLKGSLWLTI